MRVFGLILAGGEGRRMGADKAQVTLGGRPMLAHVLDRIEPQVERLALSANGDPARLAPFGLPVLPDAGESRGPLSGVLAGLCWAAAGGADWLVTVPVDTPFLPPDLVPRLLLAAGAGDAPSGQRPALARSGGRDHGTLAVWPVALAGALTGFLASGAKPAVLAFADGQGALRAIFPDDGALANINTPADLAAAEAMLSGVGQKGDRQ